MDSVSRELTLQYDMHGVVPQLLSPQSEVVLSTCPIAPNHVQVSPKSLTLEAAEKCYPELVSALRKHTGATHRPHAFTLNTSFLGNQTEGTSNVGEVLVLPREYRTQAEAISRQKPSVIMATNIDYRSTKNYFCWKTGQENSRETPDLLLHMYQEQIIDDWWLNNGGGNSITATSEELHCWTDVIVACGNQLHFGGFWTSTEDSLTIQAQGHMSCNYRAWKNWSERELQCANERALYVGHPAPWEIEVCLNEAGRYYRCVEAPYSRYYRNLFEHK